MDVRMADHAYHRSRIDAHLQGTVAFTVLIGVLAFLAGDQFKPFQQGARFWSPTPLVWTPETRLWQPAEQLWETAEELDESEKYVIAPVVDEGRRPQSLLEGGEYMITKVSPSPSGERFVREIHPISYSILFVLGSLLVWSYLYMCARRQAQRMALAAPAGIDAPRPYDRPWSEIRWTFRALLLVLLVELFLFLL
jgi:hypothetical protein